MAHVAFFFHWPLADLDAMSVDELLDWRERAVGIHNQLHQSEA
ncbi:hypothetical protein B5M06_16475 [Comamonas kerstersii]|uniref:GpE family phage tail protein n=1 Tax=Comamonas kerstersii TaxID=225992 RepID=A0A1V0BID2_9BURK|nr:GpE family phage tail protein [Comamonas kerstersii]AQZ99601.1 hypothetical protein B5M06_16475 [Comamonas kerstersii]DAG46663.1 MAG TPA: hypothetical protein [Caudoviricetes sp.]